MQWFEAKGALSREEIERRARESYFDAGWIDSLGLIEFVDELETHFNIRFSNDEFQDRSFSTIDGLAALVERKRHD